MDIHDISQLAEVMAANDLSELSLETDDCKLLLKRGRLVEAAAPAAVAATSAVGAAPAGGTDAAPDAAEASLPTITSPIVGTFYLAPAPDAPSFVKPGDHVDADTVVCIVEAMKVMNEIKAEMSGTVKRVLVDNGTPVEFGQPLFELEPV